jgi:hypothetical protein
MKHLLNTFFLSALILGLTFGAYAQAVETRNLPAFTKLASAGSLNVILVKGDRESARIEVDGIEPSKVLTDVVNGTLRIHLEKGNHRIRKGLVTVTYRELSSIQNAGSGNLTCNDALQAQLFELSSTGSGNVKIKNLQADALTMSLTGSGNLDVGGKVKDQTVKVSGSGNVSAMELQSEVAKVSVMGSGNARLFVTQDIDATVSGSGDVSYKGNATISNQKVRGSGRIRKVS